MAAHTPGPWRVEREEYPVAELYGAPDAEGYRVSVAKLHNTGPKTRDLDWLLIAAAPTMYEYVQYKADAGDEEAEALLREFFGHGEAPPDADAVALGEVPF
jgi:hypothetical protein